MKKVQILLWVILCCFPFGIQAQTENTSTVVDWRQHNLNKYNRMLVNPAYSIVGEEERAISFWSRIQWTGVNNSPQTFLLNYSGKIGESSGGGLGLYQQNLGLLTDSGILMNYAYEVRLGAEAGLTLGINSTLFRRGLNKNAVTSADPDPAVLENQDNFLWLFMPGLNLRLGGFDLGVYAENLFDYNLSESRSVTGFDSKIFSGQLGYTHTFKNAYGIFGGAVWRNLTYLKTLPNNETQYGGSSMIDLSRFGWLQVGYNNVYGVNGALGVKLGDGLSVGLVYEKGANLSGQNFGPTYEAIATIALGSGSNRKQSVVAFADQQAKDDQSNPTPVNRELVEEKEEDPLSETVVVHTGAYTVYGGNAAPVGTASNTETENGNAKEDMGDAPAWPEETQEVLVAKIREDIREDDAVVSLVTDKPENGADLREEAPAAVGVGIKAGGPNAALQQEPVRVLYRAEKVVVHRELKDAPDAGITREVLGTSETYKTMEVRQGIEKGFYLVVNVFSDVRYFKEFTKKLTDRGFTPRYFVNPDNNYWYVFLAYADNYYAVKQLQRSHMKGKYRDDKWVLWIK